MTAWQLRALDAVCPVVCVDAVQVKIREGQVAHPAGLERLLALVEVAISPTHH